MISRWIPGAQKNSFYPFKRLVPPSVLLGAVLLLAGGPTLAAQDASKPTSAATSDFSTPGHTQRIDILSDTKGVDFNPYIRNLHQILSKSWNSSLAQPNSTAGNKEGWTIIGFTINPDGRVVAMSLEGSSHIEGLNRAAWAAITSVGNFPVLPHEFSGSNLDLRIRFNVSNDTAK